MGLTELYNSIVDDVVENVREAFSEEGVDEQILKSLKESWLRRIRESQQPRESIRPATIQNQIQPHPQANLMQTQNQQLQLQQQQPQHPQLQNQQQMVTHQTNHHIQPQAGVIVYNSNHEQSQQNNQQQPRPNDNLHASTALNLSQQHRQQLVAEIQSNSNQRPPIIDNKSNSYTPQLDGSNGTSDEDNDDDESEGEFPDGDDDVDVSDEEDKETDTNRDDEDPLNSGDDVSNDESSEMFETDNVVVCQYDKITRNRNKWKFHLKDGIMNINGRDYVFQKAVGDAEW